jgi:uncharacterized protein YybS (DUF2232 family)
VGQVIAGVHLVPVRAALILFSLRLPQLAVVEAQELAVTLHKLVEQVVVVFIPTTYKDLLELLIKDSLVAHLLVHAIHLRQEEEQQAVAVERVLRVNLSH